VLPQVSAQHEMLQDQLTDAALQERWKYHGGGFGGSRFKVRVTKETTCVEESIAGSGTQAEPLEEASLWSSW